ncbi:hypothetical protein [Moorena producens]|uniref:hypothetical protein n=1 Tax=Moorena producens TaxID=1155739 RepID=UPI00131500CD|nr:hypothetical protein [Moorena producens]
MISICPPNPTANGKVGKLTEFEILLSEDKHLPTLRLREGGQMDSIPDYMVRG